MKKLLSVLLTAIIAFSVLAVIPVEASAKTTKQQKTYVVQRDYQNISEGQLYLKGDNMVRNLLLIDKNNKTKKITNYKACSIKGFVVRGSKIYYIMHRYDNREVVRVVDVDGKNDTLIYKGSQEHHVEFLGFYGSNMIIDNGSYIQQLSTKGKTVNLMKKSKNVYDSELFNGKVYIKSSNKVFNLATKKASSFKVKQIVNSKNYLYYVNKNNNLKRIDKNNKSAIMATSVKKIYFANNGATVIYGRNYPDGEVVCRRTELNGKVYKLCKVSELTDIVKDMIGDKEYWGNTNKGISSAYLVPGTVYMLVNDVAVITVGSKGSKLTVADCVKDHLIFPDADVVYDVCYLSMSRGEVSYGIRRRDADDYGDD